MSFITGASFIILLTLFTLVLFFLITRLPKEFLLTGIVLMLVGDGILVAFWYYGLVDIVSDLKRFKLGIAASFAMGAFGRSIYFMLTSDDN